MNASNPTAAPGNTSTPLWPGLTREQYDDTFYAVVRAAVDDRAYRVLQLVLSYANYYPGTKDKRPLEGARPGIPNLADETGYSHRTVTRKLKQLVDEGWLVVTKKGGGRKATIYAVVPRERDDWCSHPKSRGDTAVSPQTRHSCVTSAVTELCPPTSTEPSQDQANPVSPRLRRAAEESAAGEASGSAAAEDEAQEPRAEDDQGDALEPGVTLTEADPIPSEVLDPLIAAGNAGKSVPANIALYDAVAPLHGEKFADWLIGPEVSLKAGMSRRDAGAKFRILANTAPKQGVPVFNPPPVRNTRQVDPTHPEVQRIRDQQRRSMAEAAERAAAAETAQPAVIEPDPEALAAAEHEQRRIAQQAAYDRAQAEARQKAARDARHAAWYRDNPSAAV